MKFVRASAWIALLLYSAALLLVERSGGQEAARWYFTDLDAGGAFYGINTSICTGLLLGSALVFFLTRRVSDVAAGGARARAFYSSQVLIFLYLALDERLMLHERLGLWFGVGDAWILLAGTLELAALWCWGELPQRGRAAIAWLLGAGAFFGVMMLVDGALPSGLHFRLSVEDLSKTWSAACLFGFALECHRGELLKCSGGQRRQ